MKPSVMCVTKEAITDNFSLNNLPNEHIHFMNREVVDKIPEVGKMFPQIIPVIAVKKDNKYLTYARNGTEGRLHGKRSMTVGGHIDISDTFGSDYKNYRPIIALAASREVLEETLPAVLATWVQEKLQQATKDGYVTLAFGLRLRTPLLAQSILNTTSTMNEASQEARTAGNALSGQSYGLLNNRAIIAFMKKVWASKWRTDIKPVALIHDAIYLLIKDDIECVKWVNDNLIEEMSWQELPEIQHPDVHLGAELDIYYPTWNNAITLPNNISEEEILAICSNNSL